MQENNIPSSHNDRRVEAHRQRIGQMVCDRENARINKDLQSHLAEQFFARQRQVEAGTQTSVQIPSTTRGVGLNTFFSYFTLSRRNVKAAQQVTSSLPMYRIALLQLKRQLYEGEQLYPGNFPDHILPYRQSTLFDQRFYSLTRSQFSLTSNSIGMMGSLKYGDAIYRTYIPDLKTQRVETIESANAQAAYNEALCNYNRAIENKDPNPPAAPQRPQRIMINLVVPDPYLVTIDNLRSIVEALSNPACPPDQRLYFRNLNPIPEALWSADNILLNPDQIMPVQYGELAYQEDVRITLQFFNMLRGVDKCYVYELSFEGRASESTMCTTSQRYRPEDALSAFSIESLTNFRDIVPITVRCPFDLSGVHKCNAALSLMSELPFSINQVFEQEWCFRSPSLSRSTIEYSWSSLVNGVFNTTN